MTIPKSNLKDYNVLIFAAAPQPARSGPLSRIFRWALLHRTYTVWRAQDSRHDGVWPGIASVSAFRQSLGSLSEDNMVLPTVTVELARADEGAGLRVEDLQCLRDLDYLVGAAVEFFLVGENDPLPSAANRFHVAVIERGDVEIDRSSVRITCRDRREGDNQRIPKTRFPGAAPVEEKMFGRPIPILIGEWDRENSDYWIPAACVDTVPTSNVRPIRAELCRPGEYGIGGFGSSARWLSSDGRYKRDETGYREIGIRVVDAAEGIFELVGTDFDTFGERWEEGDEIQVCRPRGNLDSGGRLITSPSEVIRHLLTDRRVGLGLSESALDPDSFETVSGVMDYYGYKCRGYIAEETTVFDAISQICHEFGIKLIVRNGLYALVYLGWNDSLGAPSRKIVPGQILDWQEWNDRQRAGARGLQINYRLRPRDEVFTRNLYFSSESDRGSGSRTIDSRWIYDDESAEQRGSNWALLFDGVIRTLRLSVDFEGLGIMLGDYVEATWPEGTGIFQVTDISYNFDLPIRVDVEMQTTNRPPAVGVWSAEKGEAVPELFGGGLMPDGWNDALPGQRERLSFWSEDSGLDPDGTDAGVWGR